MFLAFNEIRHSKLRYGLIVLTIALISYLTFILSALAFGLAQSNRTVIDTWDAQNIVLNSDVDGVLRQSSLTQKQIDDISSDGQIARLGELSDIASGSKQGTKKGIEVLGVSTDEFIYNSIAIESGKNFQSTYEAVADDSLKAQGYVLGEKLKLSSGGHELTLVGFTHHSQLSVAPVVYVSLDTWHELKFGRSTQTQSTQTSPSDTSPGSNVAGSAVVIRNGKLNHSVEGTQELSINEFIEKLPGYSAQNITFNLMIGFLFVITLIIIAIFLYILTMQKIANYTVLKIQGIPTGFLVRGTFGQALLLSITGVIIGAILTALTAIPIPATVPISFNIPMLTIDGLAIIAMSLLGALVSAATIVKIKPTSIVSGE